MRKIFVLVIESLFIFVFLLATPALAEEVNGIEKAAVYLDFYPGMPMQTGLDLVTILNSEWLALELETKLKLPFSDEFGAVNLKFNFPIFSETWDSYLRYLPEDDQYEWAAGSSDRYQLFEPLELKLQADFGGRASSVGSIYINQWQSQTLKFDYLVNDWNYQLDLIHTAKEYPLANYYTSTKFNLAQKLVYRYSDFVKFGLASQEDTGAYPDPRSLERNYYQNSYQLFGQGKYADIYWWNGEYSQVRRLQGYGLHHTQKAWQLWLTAAWWENAELVSRLRISDFDYFTTEITLTDDEGDLSEDPQSRFEQSVSLAYRWRQKRWKTECGIFWKFKDYKIATSTEVARFGWYTAWRFEYKWGNLYLKAAPQGSQESEKASYQVGIEYRS